MEDSLPLRFKVRYRLGEYLHIVRAQAFSMPELANCSSVQKVAYNAILSVIWSGAFLYKTFRVGTCHFVIDRAGISRRSKGDRLINLAWSDVACVREYKVGYYIEKKNGAMPVPFRVLSAQQQGVLAALVAPHLHAT